MSTIITGFLFTIGAVLALVAVNAVGFWVFAVLASIAALYFFAPWLLAMAIVYPWLGPALGALVAVALIAAAIYERKTRQPQPTEEDVRQMLERMRGMLHPGSNGEAPPEAVYDEPDWRPALEEQLRRLQHG